MLKMQQTPKTYHSSLPEINALIEEGTDSQTNPSRLAEILQELSGWYSFLSDHYDATEKQYNQEWLVVRERVSSVAQADREMDMRTIGTERKQIKHKLTAIDKVMSSIRTRIRMKSEEARNIF